MINKTESRVEALTEVKAERISYDPATGDYFTDGERVSGAKRRTLAELRADGAIVTEKPHAESLVYLTNEGNSLALEWGVD